MSFSEMITSLFRPRSVVNRVVEDPREPDCPRTPKNEWKPRTDFEDPRSPSLGIRRSPIARAKLWSYASKDPIILTVTPPTKEKEDLLVFEESKREEPIVNEQQCTEESSAVATVVMKPVPVATELEKLRMEFSVKHQDSPAVFSSPLARSAKQFLSSPALWKTISSSPMMDSPVPTSAISDPLLQTWQSPSARRSLFTRQESASAA